MSDYHCHCDYSFDAVGTIHEYCRAAVKRDLAELCFTTHYDCEPRPDGSLKDENFIRIDGQLKPLSPDLLARYVDDVRAAHEEYYPYGLSVRLGLEFGWYPGCEDILLELRELFSFEYVLVGVHNLGGIPLEECFIRMSLEEAVEGYFREVVAAVGTGLFDTLAHPDYYKRHGRAFYGEPTTLAHLPYIDEVFQALKFSNTCLEVNTAALRHGHPEYYPKMEIVNDARNAGVMVRYLGSDAHLPAEVGFDFEAAHAVVPPFVAGREG
jgi:histidinol-phosphatase (PHP family)